MKIALEQVAWAEDEFLKKLESLPEALLQAHYGNPEWTVGVIAAHIVSGACWYEFCLTGYFPPEPSTVTTAAELAALRPSLAARNQVIVAQADLPDEELRVIHEDEDFTVRRSTLLAQVVHHSVEHRAQIGAALEANGCREIDLDGLDVWSYVSATQN